MLLATIGLGVAVLVGVASMLRIPAFETAGDASPAAPASPPDEAGLPEVPWVFFSQLPPGGGPGAFVVQAGVFGEERPRVDIEVPWSVDTAVEVARTPAVARPSAGAIVYVADDGETSTVQRVDIEPGANPEALATTDDAIWSIAVMPDQSAAFVAATTRGRPDADLGIFRVALDGSGAIEPFLPPLAQAPPAETRLVAIAPFSVTLDISADGRYLARTSCRGAAGCTTEIIDIATRNTRDVGDDMIMDLGTDEMIIVEGCDDLGCGARVVDVESGASLKLASQAFDTTVTSIDGRAVIAGIEPADGGAVLVLTDPRSGVRRELYRATDDHWMMLGNRSHLMPVIDSAIVVVELGNGKDDIGERYLLLALDGSGGVELPPPPIRPILPGGAQG